MQILTDPERLPLKDKADYEHPAMSYYGRMFAGAESKEHGNFLL